MQAPEGESSEHGDPPRLPPADNKVSLVVEMGHVTNPDLTTVEALARLQLAAGRLDYAICLRGAPPTLRALLALVGLDGVLPLCPGSELGLEGKTEEREQPGCVEKEVEPCDLAGRNLEDVQ